MKDPKIVGAGELPVLDPIDQRILGSLRRSRRLSRLPTVDRAPMASGRQWHLKHERQAREAAAGVSCGPGQARWTSMHGRQTTRDDGVLIVRKLIAWVFLYSLDG